MVLIESTHYNGEVREIARQIKADTNIQVVIRFAQKRNAIGANRAWRVETDAGKIIKSHCDPAFMQYLKQ